MPQSLANGALTSPDNARVIPRPRPAKVTTPDKTASVPLSGVVLEAAKKAYGKQGAAAAQLGKDEGNFSRDVKAGRVTIGQLEGLGAEFLAAFGEELQQQFGSLVSPKDHARRLIRDIEQALSELRQYIEDAAA